MRDDNTIRSYVKWGYDQAEALINCNIEIRKINGDNSQ